MNTAYLRTFIEVVNLRSFSKAADKLYFTQPAITKQIKSLEKDFDTVLIRRSYNDIILTKEGKDLYKYALTILNKEEEIYAKIMGSKEKVSGELIIYSSTLPANYMLDKILYDFTNKYNQIYFNIKKIDSKKVYEKVIDGSTSFGFTGMQIKNKNIECIEIASDTLVLAVSANKYKHLNNKEIELKQLLELDFLIREKGSATLRTFEEAFKKGNHSISDLKIKGIIADNEIIKKMILKGLGVSVMSRLSIDKEVNEGTILPIKIKDISLNRSIYYIYHKNRYYSNIENKFKEFIQQMFIN